MGVTISPGATTTVNESLAGATPVTDGGNLRGTVTDAVTGLPLKDIVVNACDLYGNLAGITGTRCKRLLRYGTHCRQL